MKKQLLTFITAISLLLSCAVLYAQNDSKNTIPDFTGWTEKQIKQWDDSVRKALYPELEIRKMTGDEALLNEKVSTKATSKVMNNNTYVPNSVTIDKTKMVGEIPIQSEVSQSGAVSYQVPIEVYPGVHGMQPQLAIVYNHQAGNGILGVGWAVSGLSSISRGGQSIYYDGKSQGVVLTKDDAFYLNGMRLIKLSETSTQIKYESEQGNVKATANISGTVVKYFDVFFPNGLKGTYGYTTNSSTTYLEYPMTAISDLYNNTITYSYTYTDNHYRISNISYANASVEFQYQTNARTDVITAYNGGLKVKEDKLLQKIICKFGSSVLRNYEFSYTFQKEASLLQQIGCSAANGSEFNPLKFYYGENNTATAYEKNETQLIDWYNWTNPNQIRVGKGKIDYGTDNDGLIVLPNSNSYWQYRASLSVHQQFQNLYNGAEKIFLYTGLKNGFVMPMPNLTTEAGFVDILCANVDGKREEEIIKVNNVVSGTNDQVVFKVYTPNMYGGLDIKDTHTFNLSTVLDFNGMKSIHPKFYYTGDFNGDGKMEVLAVSCNQPLDLSIPSKCYLFDLESGTKLYEGQPFAYNVTFAGTYQQDSTTIAQNTDKLYILDYDGDGKSDICLINASGTYIYTFDNSGTSCRLVSSYTGLKRSDLNGKLLMIGEFNGDGKPDFLLSPVINASDWYIFYATGNGQFEKVQTSIYPRYSNYRYHIQDVNSDGLTDLIVYTATYFETYRLRNGTLFIYEGNTYFSNSSPYFIPTNINSRNYYQQLVALRKDGIVDRFSYPRNDTKEKLLTGAVSSFGVVGKNYYRMLNESPNLHTKGAGAEYPHENFHGPLFVPETREQYFNGVLNESSSYTYQNAVIHKQGLGFRGFETINLYDNMRGRTQTRKFDPYKFGILKSQETYLALDTFSYSVDVASNKITKIRMTNRYSLNKPKNTAFNHIYSNYDTYGNPQNETINYGNGITETLSSSFSNNTDETGYQLGFLYDRTKTTNRNGSTWSERYYVPAYSNGQPSVIIKYANGNQVSYETFGYDTQGNATARGVKTYSSSNTLTTGYIYDSYGRKTKETDPMGFNTTYDYHPTNGSLSAVKNHKDQATTFTYDAFGRLGKIDYAYGGIETLSYYWTTSERGTNTLYCKYHHHYSKPWTKTHYDALGRETSSSILTLNSAESGPDKLYDYYGRLWKVSVPFETGGTGSLWNVYQYDNYDRITAINEASGRETTYSYNGNSVTTTIDGIASTQTFDMQGNLTSVSDPAGTITYNLRPDGQPSSIVAPGSITTSFGYDSYGRRTGITDPSAGTKSLTYDAAGNIETETDANNKSITYEYDNYYRLKKKICPEYTANYRYNSDGLLAADSINSTLFTSYIYDQYGRLHTERETVAANKWIEKSYGYHSLGQLGWTTYNLSNNFITTEIYSGCDGDEGIKGITVDGTEIWKRNTANAFGQTTNVKTGNFNRTYNFDAYGMPTGRTASSFQNHTYSFDAAKGNLSYREDNEMNILESFTYDSLNRLTGFAEETATYDTKGNITSRTDAGTFLYYISGKPYALSEVASPTNLLLSQTVTYTSFQRPATITEGEYTATFTYNSRNERVKMVLKKNDVMELTRYYLSDCYEIDERAVTLSYETGDFRGTGLGFKPEEPILRNIREKLYLGGNFYTAPAVYVKEEIGGIGGNWDFHYICRDYLGSITHITNSSGSVVQELSYDAWGQLRNPANQTVYAPDAAPELFLGRGYTGHEHLPMFGLVNMNARLYDPYLGRFLSPDPYVQNPLFSQNFNRYSYALNNPFKYIDPSGEIVWWLVPVIAATVFGTGNLAAHAMRGDVNNLWDGLKYFGQGAVTGFALGCAWQFAPLIPYVGSGIQTTMTIYGIAQGATGILGSFLGMGNLRNPGNGLMIFLGNFYLDENNWLGGIWQGFSRHTWEIFQSFGGHAYTQGRNAFGDVSRIDYFGGATFATRENAGYNDGISLGNYINTNIDHEITGNFSDYVLNNPMYMHEYGHTIDSRAFGFSYLFAIGIPSIISANKANNDTSYNHYEFWTEKRANRRAEKYFRKYSVNWNFPQYPLN